MLLLCTAFAQRSNYRARMDRRDQAIRAAVQAKSQLVRNLEFLSDRIGPRLSGSPAMAAADSWAVKLLRGYGLKVWQEPVTLHHGWLRGSEQAEMLAPMRRPIPIHSLGWAPATNGWVRGDVVLFTPSNKAGLAPYRGHLKGKIVLLGWPKRETHYELNAPDAYDAVIGTRKLPARPQLDRQTALRFLQRQKAAVVLLDSGKPDALFTMGSSNGDHLSPLPVALLTHEDYSWLARLAPAGGVRMKLRLDEHVTRGPVRSANVVAQIQGTGPGQVILAAHLDSWDLGQGALDNGAGAAAVMEAAHTLAALHWQPRRTITFLLFTGEEEGGLGSLAYVARHTGELPDIDAVLVLDTGTGRIFSLALENQLQAEPLFRRLYQPLRDVFELQPFSMRDFSYSDQDSFLNKGVPAFFAVQRTAAYLEAHHSQADTFDKVRPQAANFNAAVLASWAWNTAQLPGALPHSAH